MVMRRVSLLDHVELLFVCLLGDDFVDSLLWQYEMKMMEEVDSFLRIW